MTCRVIWAGPDTAAWVCFGDMEQRWAQAMSGEWYAEYELEADLARELELDPFEEAETEMAPIDWAEVGQ